MPKNATFVTNYAGKMEKGFRQRRERLYHIHGSFESFWLYKSRSVISETKSIMISENTLKLMCSYLKDRWQAVQINNNFISYKKLQAGVPQGSIDGLFLFILFINDFELFLPETFLSNYADDNDLCSTGKELNITNEKFEKILR